MILAASGEATLALIAAISAVLVAFIGGVFTLATAKATKASVGKSNGQGTIVEMSERILIEVGRLHEKIDDHTEQDTRNFRALEDRLQTLGG